MSITEDFTTMKHNKDVAELAIKIRAGLEYTKRVLDEQIALADEAIAEKDFSSVPESIRTEGKNILDDMRMLRDHLSSKHKDFLTI